MLKFKVGVKLRGLQPQMLVALMVAKQVFDQWQLDLVVTSANDSEHSTNSLHYAGKAFDLRTKHTGMSKAVADAIRNQLAPLGFDVILEDLGGVNEHLHVEYDPKN